jgi:porphobilinogen synthase
MRRLRRTESLRKLVRETTVSPNDLIYPMFVSTASEPWPIESMPGIYRHSLDSLCRTVEEALAVGIHAFMLFGIPDEKDEVGSSGYAADGIVPTAIRALRRTFGSEITVIPDVCLCEYTSHGHCGALNGTEIDNDATLKLLARAALCYAEAGADIIAPSDMMDGRVAVIREALDSQSFDQIPIMAYSAKYASGFYGPFRVAADSAPQFGDRRTYQMDPANRREAMREIELDIAEGADIVMVKPGLAYLDLLREARDRYDHPLAVYNVSGEYSMVKAAALNGWIDESRVVHEILLAFKRAGADLILTYHAVEYARDLVHAAQA